DRYTTARSGVCMFTPLGEFIVGGERFERQLDDYSKHSWAYVSYDKNGGSNNVNLHTVSEENQGVGALAFNPADLSIILAGASEPLLTSGSTDGFVPSPLTHHIDIAALPDGRFYMLDRDGRLVRMTVAGAVDPTFPLV